MSALILNGERARANIEIDRRIFDQFTGYTLQYVCGLPDHLYLADPSYATINAIVLVDVTERNNRLNPERLIYIDFYHPLLNEPLRIQTTDDFSMVLAIEHSDLEVLKICDVDVNDPPPTDYFFDNLFKHYPAFTRVDASIAQSIVHRHTLDIESIEMP